MQTVNLLFNNFGWYNLESKIAEKISGFTFETDKTYYLQNLDRSIRILEASTLPENTNNDGFIVKPSNECQTAAFTKQEGLNVYIKITGRTEIIIN